MKKTAIEYYVEQMQLKEQFTQEEFDNITNQAKEKERMYSEEEVKEILTKCTSKLTESKLRWFELFGKK